MTSEEQVRVLSLRVAAAPENSDEFRVARGELRVALKASAASGQREACCPEAKSRSAIRGRAAPLLIAGYLLLVHR